MPFSRLCKRIVTTARWGHLSRKVLSHPRGKAFAYAFNLSGEQLTERPLLVYLTGRDGQPSLLNTYVHPADPRENPRRRTRFATRNARVVQRPPTRPVRETRFDIRLYLFIYFATRARTRETSLLGVRAVLRSGARSQERRSQFCATSMSRMSSIAGAFRLACTANDRYPDARIMDVSVARRTPRMQRIIVMRDGRRAGDAYTYVCLALAENHQAIYTVNEDDRNARPETRTSPDEKERRVFEEPGVIEPNSPDPLRSRS